MNFQYTIKHNITFLFLSSSFCRTSSISFRFATYCAIFSYISCVCSFFVFQVPFGRHVFSHRCHLQQRHLHQFTACHIHSTSWWQFLWARCFSRILVIAGRSIRRSVSGKERLPWIKILKEANNPI